MESLTEDLWAIILAKLPLKSNTASKLVCQQWKSIVESPFMVFRDLFLSMHQNSPTSSWSLMWSSYVQVVAHYGCDIWGLERSLGSYIKSFRTIFEKHQIARVAAFSDAGLILFHVKQPSKNKISLYVANPVSRQCVEIFINPLLMCHMDADLSNFGLATRTEKGVLLGYKVVVYDYWNFKRDELGFRIYSSETGFWSLQTFPLPSPNSFDPNYFRSPISLNGNLHWHARNEVVLSIDLFATSTGSGRCRVTPLPDLGKYPKFIRACTTCQGFLMYMNIVSVVTDGNLEDKLCVWRLQSEGWQLVSEISPAFILTDFIDYFPLTLNPFDAKTAYFWSKKQNRLISINLHNGKFVLHSHSEHSKYYGTMISVKDPRFKNFTLDLEFSSFVLPQWLHQIPDKVRRV